MMRKFAAGILAVSVLAAACSEAAEHAMEPADPSAIYSAVGTVTAVDDAFVTIDHQPIEALGWPSMTMQFGLDDSAMAEGIAPGAQVEFSFRRDGSMNMLTEITPRN